MVDGMGRSDGRNVLGRMHPIIDCRPNGGDQVERRTPSVRFGPGLSYALSKLSMAAVGPTLLFGLRASASVRHALFGAFSLELDSA